MKLGWQFLFGGVLKGEPGREWRLQAPWWQRDAAAPPASRLSPLADVKPSNVLINALGQVKMCDFGISGYLVDSVAKTIDAGCKPYMAVSTAPGVALGEQETLPGNRTWAAEGGALKYTQGTRSVLHLLSS